MRRQPWDISDEREPEYNTEEYDAVNENIFHDALRNPLSTFSIDVDAASYSNVRRFINNGQRPPKDAVRIEELVNYFNYDYQQPKDDVPFAVHTEISTAPWNSETSPDLDRSSREKNSYRKSSCLKPRVSHRCFWFYVGCK